MIFFLDNLHKIDVNRHAIFLSRCVGCSIKSKEGVFNRNNSPYCFLQVQGRLFKEVAWFIHIGWAVSKSSAPTSRI